MKALLRAIREDLWIAILLPLAATIALAAGLNRATAASIPEWVFDPSQGTGVGTLPRISMTVSDSATTPAPTVPNGEWSATYLSGGISVRVSAVQQPGENDGAFAHRCSVKLAAFKVEFPPDP